MKTSSITEANPLTTPQTLTQAATKLKKFQSSLYRGLSSILHAQKADTITYHNTLEILGRCIADLKTATDPSHVQQLQSMEIQATSILRGLEGSMAGVMQMVRDMRVANAHTQMAFEKIKRVERKWVVKEGTRRSARIKERCRCLVADEVVD